MADDYTLKCQHESWLSREAGLSVDDAESAAAGLASFVRQDASRPGIPYGAASGDVTRDRAIIWSRTDRPARMLVEWSTTESFQSARRVRGPADRRRGRFHRAHRSGTGLPPGQRIFYRVQFEDLADSRNLSVPAAGSFCRRRARPRDVTVRLVRRHRRTGLGHQQGVGRHAHVRDDAPRAARLLHPYRRHDLRRLAGPR